MGALSRLAGLAPEWLVLILVDFFAEIYALWTEARNMYTFAFTVISDPIGISDQMITLDEILDEDGTPVQYEIEYSYPADSLDQRILHWVYRGESQTVDDWKRALSWAGRSTIPAHGLRFYTNAGNPLWRVSKVDLVERKMTASWGDAPPAEFRIGLSSLTPATILRKRLQLGKELKNS